MYAFFIKSYTQFFMTRNCFNKLFQTSENENTAHLTPTTINNDYPMLKSL